MKEKRKTRRPSGHATDDKERHGIKNREDDESPRSSDARALAQVLAREHLLGALHDGILGRVIGEILGGDLEHGRDRLVVLVDQVANELGDL